MSKLFLLSKTQMDRLTPYFPLAHGVPRVDDRRVVSGIIYVIRNGLQWQDAPKAYGPHRSEHGALLDVNLCPSRVNSQCKSTLKPQKEIQNLTVSK